MKQVASSAFGSGKLFYIEQYSYNSNNLIGSGFSSKVYKGRNEQTKEDVAIKIIDRKKFQNPIEEQLLRQEINALSIMQSVNVIKMYDHFHKNDATYIITEYCNQGNLGQLIKKNQFIPELDAVQIFKQILNGFKEQVNKQIIHRDLKPINIFIKDGQPKLADYGFSKMMNAPKETVYYNVGTALYMSPQTMIRNIYSEKTDIWSLGVIFYEMLFGQVPFSANSEQEMAKVITRQTPQFPSNIPVSKDAISFIMRCLTVDDRERISCSEMDYHPLFMRRNTATVPRPLMINNRSISIRNAKSPERYTEYQPRTEDRNMNYILKLGLQKSVQFNVGNDEVIDAQLNFIDFVTRVLLALKKFKLLQHDLLDKLQYCLIKNMYLKCCMLKDTIIKKFNHFNLLGFESYNMDKYVDRVATHYEKIKQLYSQKHDSIEQNRDLKMQLLRDRIFEKVYSYFQNSDDHKFYQLISRTIITTIQQLNNDLKEQYTFTDDQFQQQLQFYLLDQLTLYYSMIKILIDTNNDVQTFTRAADFRTRQPQFTKENLETIRSIIQEMRI